MNSLGSSTRCNQETRLPFVSWGQATRTRRPRARSRMCRFRPCHNTTLVRHKTLLPPLHEPLQRIELRQPQLVVHLRGVAVAVLGALPELAFVGAAGEHRLASYRDQSVNFRPGTSLKSRMFRVTRVAPDSR